MTAVRWWHRWRRPPRPLNVRLQLADGTNVPLEVRFAGHDPRGWRVWHAVPANGRPLPTLADLSGGHISIGSLPPRTAVSLAMAGPPP